MGTSGDTLRAIPGAPGGKVGNPSLRVKSQDKVEWGTRNRRVQIRA